MPRQASRYSSWVLIAIGRQDTVFSVDGSHLISVGRDMAAKLTEMATQRFVDNITSITPGALKGGLATVARHPKRDEIVIGGSDGEPKLYRVFRRTSRVIGDDSNLIREFPPLPGRVYSVAISTDGKRIAAGSSLDGFSGEVAVYSYDFDTALPDNIKAINEKVVTARSAAETAALDAYHKAGVKQISSVKVSQGGIYTVAFRPDGKIVAAAGGDGIVRLIDPEKGTIVKEFAPVPVRTSSVVASTPVDLGAAEARRSRRDRSASRRRRSSMALEVQPREIRLSNRFAYAQLLVTGKLASGETIDVTRMVETKFSAEIAAVTRSGLVRPKVRRQGDAHAEPGRQVGGVAGGRTRIGHTGTCRLRSRRGPGALAPGLQRGNLSRIGAGEEWIQTLAPRLRSTVRRPGPD